MLATHRQISPSVGLPGNYRHLGNRCLGVRVEELCSVPYYPSPLLDSAGEEAWDIHESHDWYVVAVTRSDESRGLDGRIDIQASC